MNTKSQIFHTNAYKDLEKGISVFLNGQIGHNILKQGANDAPRAVGEEVEKAVRENMNILFQDVAKDYSAQFARRAMADCAFLGVDDLYYVVDIKTHRLDKGFHMPNLTSVHRLSRFYEDNENYFCIMKVNYAIENTKITVKEVVFVPIEFISWSCLTIGALGWGQIQITNADNLTVAPETSRRDWMIEMCDNLLEFYPREIAKIDERISYFRKVKKYWQDKT